MGLPRVWLTFHQTPGRFTGRGADTRRLAGPHATCPARSSWSGWGSGRGGVRRRGLDVTGLQRDRLRRCSAVLPIGRQQEAVRRGAVERQAVGPVGAIRLVDAWTVDRDRGLHGIRCRPTRAEVLRVAVVTVDVVRGHEGGDRWRGTRR